MPVLDVDGGGIFYSVKGEGVPIVFIHPPVLTGEIFRYQSEELSKFFQVITFDVRGNGRSPFSTKPVTYPLIVGDIINLLDHHSIEKAFFCGYSTGCSVLLEFMLTHPNRVIGGIIISGMSEVNDIYNKQRITLGVKLSRPKSFPLLARALTWGNAETKETYKWLYNQAIKSIPQNIRQYFQYSLEYNCTRQLDRIVNPIFLVYGKKDHSFQYYAKILHEKLPRNELVFLEKEKHQIPTKAVAKLNPLLIEFVQKYRPSLREEGGEYH